MRFIAIIGILLISSSCHAFTAAGVLTCYEGGNQIVQIPVDGTKPYSIDTFRRAVATDASNGMKYTVHADCVLQETP